jgi:glycosyltransferase involved in cell wall biosynthesis
MPLCSIVMPVYNGDAFLEAALKSIFSQTVTDFELIVIDDGSTDKTATILASYAADRRLKIITHSENKGIVAGLNGGITAATTNLIVRIDADDMMLPNRIEQQLTYMQANPSVGGAGSFYYVVDEFGEVRGAREVPLTTVEELNRYIDGGGNPIFPHPTMIIRKDIVQRLGGYRAEFQKCEDIDLFLRMIAAGHPVLIQPQYLTYFRTHGASTTAMSGRFQFELSEVLFTNFRRRRMGLPEIPAVEFKASLARLSALKKFYREVRYRSKVCLRRRDMAKLRNRRVAAFLLLMGAAACDLGATFGKLRRQLTRQV